MQVTPGKKTARPVGGRLVTGWILAGAVVIGLTAAASIPQYSALADALARLQSADVLLALIAGSAIGVVVGALPGINPVTALGIMFPLTFGWDSIGAMYFLIAITGGAIIGGIVPAIMINVPGDPPNIVTVLDGYPMARKGEGGRALGAAATASILGDFVGIIVMIILLPFIQKIILNFTSAEFFWLMTLAIVTVGFAIKGNVIKALLAGVIGLLVNMVGVNPLFSAHRFDGYSPYLYDGFSMSVLIVGLVALSQMFQLQVEGEGSAAAGAAKKLSGVWRGVRDVFMYPVSFVRNSLIGIVVGILPGLGGVSAAFMCYGSTMRASKHPETFGTGEVEGVIAPAIGTATERGGAVLTTVAFGVPGNPSMALILGAFVLHGITPGPLLIIENANIVWALIWGLAIATTGSCLLGLVMAPWMSKIAEVKNYYLIPIVVVLCVAGGFSNSEVFWDVITIVLAGFFGFALQTFGFPFITFSMGFILGRGTETFFHRTLMSSLGSYAPFFTRPISLIIFLIIAAIIVVPFVQYIARRAKTRREKSSAPKMKWESRTGILKTPSFWFSLFLFILPLGFFVMSLGIHDPGARLFPLMVSVPGILMGGLVLAGEKWPQVLAPFVPQFGMGRKIVREGVEEAEKVEEPESTLTTRETAKRVGALGGWIAGYILVILLVGFNPANFLLPAGYLMVHGKASWWKAIIIGALVAALMYVTFTVMMQADMFPGLLFGGYLDPILPF